MSRSVASSGICTGPSTSTAILWIFFSQPSVILPPPSGFFRKMLKDEPLLSPGSIGTDGARTFPSAIKAAEKEGLLRQNTTHHVTKHLQQAMPKVGGFQSFATARRTIKGFEATLWLRKGFGFIGLWSVREQNDLLSVCFGLLEVNKV